MVPCYILWCLRHALGFPATHLFRFSCIFAQDVYEIFEDITAETKS